MPIWAKSACCVAALTVALACQAAEDPASVAGRWAGVVEVPGSGVEVIIDIARDAQGGWIGSAILPGFGVKGAQLAGVTVKGSDLAFTIKGAMGEPKFSGQLTADGALAGDCQQAGNSARFLLSRVGEAQVEPVRQSTAVAKELEGDWDGALEVMENKMRVSLKLSNQPAGKATGQFTVSEGSVPLSLIVQEEKTLEFEIDRFGIRYEGLVNQQNDEISGIFHQGAVDIPLTLRRAVSKGAGSKSEGRVQ